MARPRKFNEDAVLYKATDIFWSKGYDGTSVAELTKTMGISAPSLYFAFGSKRGLFDAVLERYDQRRLAHRDWILAAPTGREAAKRMLIGAVEWLTTADEPLGCLLVQSGLANGLADCDVATELSRRRNRIRAMLRERFELAQQQGDLASTQDADALALYIQTVFDGLCLQAAAGTARQQLETVVARALMSWPV